MRSGFFAVVLLGLGLVACGPEAEKGDKGDPGNPGPQGPQGPPGDPGGGGGTTGQQIVEVASTGQLQVSSATNFTLIPGMTTTVAIPANARVHVSTNGGVQCTAVGNAYSVVDVALFVDDAITAGQQRVVAANTAALAQTISNWSFGRSFTLPAGNHEFEVRAAGVDANAATANVSSGTAPQIQGVLTVTVVLL